jgi:hypothetical protein
VSFRFPGIVVRGIPAKPFHQVKYMTVPDHVGFDTLNLIASGEDSGRISVVRHLTSYLAVHIVPSSCFTSAEIAGPVMHPKARFARVLLPDSQSRIQVTICISTVNNSDESPSRLCE